MQSDTIKNLNIRVELDYISFLSYTIWLINLSALDMVITCSYHVHQQIISNLHMKSMRVIPKSHIFMTGSLSIGKEDRDIILEHCYCTLRSSA